MPSSACGKIAKRSERRRAGDCPGLRQDRCAEAKARGRGWGAAMVYSLHRLHRRTSLPITLRSRLCAQTAPKWSEWHRQGKVFSAPGSRDAVVAGHEPRETDRAMHLRLRPQSGKPDDPA